jgi:hypothetical protein
MKRATAILGASGLVLVLSLPGWASPFDPQTQRPKPPAWSGATSGAEGASNGVTSGAEARLHQNSLRQTRLRDKPRLRHNSSS